MTPRQPRPPITHPPHQTCTLCRYKLPPTQFHTNTRNPNGLQNICKPCRRIYQHDYRTHRKRTANKDA